MNKMEFKREGHLNDEDILYRTAEVGEWPLNGHCSVIHSHHHHSRHLRIVSSSSENNVSTSTALRERFQQTRISGSDGHLKIAHNNQEVGPGWPTSNLDPGHEFKASGLLSQMHHKWSSNIGNLGSKLFDLSSNMFSRDHENQYVPRQNIGNDDFEIIERQELVRLRLLTNNGHSNVDPTTVRHGHRFVPANLKRSNWCDKCGGFIWGISKYCYICINCRYTCHLKCCESVMLDCMVTADNDSLNEEETDKESSSDDNSEGNDDESGYFTCRSTSSLFSRDRLQKRIDEFNKNNHGLQMTVNVLEGGNSFHGSVRVHMNLIRPITMSISSSPPSAYAALTHDTENYTIRPNATQVMSFYLPKSTSKVIYISSTTTAQEVIRALLSKFRIADNPRKFALYERNIGSKKSGVMRKMAEDEQPLAVCLSWSDGGINQLDSNSFVLQENDCGEIIWEEFSLPELESFLVFLNREEEEHMEQVRDKYHMLRVQLQNQLKQKEQKKGHDVTTDDRRQPVFV